jgi:hypothetical protein
VAGPGIEGRLKLSGRGIPNEGSILYIRGIYILGNI